MARRRLPSAEYQDLLNQPRPDDPETFRRLDVFRLVIRGHADLEATLDSFLELVFIEDAAKEISRLSFWRKHRLLFNLGLLPREVCKALESFSRIRNRLAHGEIDEPGWSDVRQAALDVAKAYPGRVNGPGLVKLIDESRNARFAIGSTIMTLRGTLESYRDGHYKQRIREIHAVDVVDPTGELLRQIRPSSEE